MQKVDLNAHNTTVRVCVSLCLIVSIYGYTALGFHFLFLLLLFFF